MQPTFSIVIANWNYAHLVGDAIESALHQDYPAGLFDVIVVDDGSTDDSRPIIETYLGRPGFRAVFQDNRGHAAALEAGVKASRSQFVCFLDSDDLCLPNKLTEIAAHIEAIGATPETLFLCHDLSIHDARTGETLERTWLQTMGADRYGASAIPSRLDRVFPFSNPSGEVFGHGLITDILQALPPWAFTRGPDIAICLAAALKTWRIDYLQKCLGVYRVHGGNEVGRVVNGEYTVGLRWRERRPRLLGFLERWVDGLALDAAERSKRTSVLRRIERMSRTSAPSRGVVPPTVSIAILGHCREEMDRSRRSGLDQHHPRVELLLPEDCGQARDACDAVDVRTFRCPPDAGQLAQMAAAYARASGAYIVFVRAGDCLDPEFVAQHLLWRQHGALVGLSCSDIRLVTPDRALVHADVFAHSGAWKQALQQVPPLATRLHDWIVSSISACMFRRTVFLDRLFARADAAAPSLHDAGMWLPVQLQQHTAGTLRIRETLSTSVIEEGAGASYGYLSSPADANGALLVPPVDAALAWFAEFYDAERALFEKWLPSAWHTRFASWLEEQSISGR